MTPSSTASISNLAQPRPQAAPFLRPNGDRGAFGDLLSGLLGPASVAEPESADAAETAAQDAEAESSGAESDEDGVDEAPAGDGDGEARPSNEGADKAEHAGGSSGSAAEQRPIPAEAHTTASIARELTHAATVDLAEVAHEQLVDPKRSGKHQPPEQDPLHTPPPPRPPITASGSGGGDAPPPTSGVTTPGTPNRQPDATGSAAPMPSGKMPGSDAPLRANSPAETAGPDASESARTAAAAAPAVRTEQTNAAPADARALLLQRLTGSAEAGRGAVAAPDRVGYQATGRDPAALRPAPTIADSAPRQTREAVLNTVQRGLASVLGQGGGRMTLVLRPEQLGEVRVRLEAKDGVVNARLAATTDAARRTLESGLDTLRAALESRGVRVESLTVDPPENAADTTPQGTVNPDARGQGGGGHDPDARRHGGERGRATQPHVEEGEPNARTDIWTELGIDAVA